MIYVKLINYDKESLQEISMVSIKSARHEIHNSDDKEIHPV